MTGRRFLWFAPNAGNWVTYRMEHRVANALADAGDSVVMVQCDRVLDAYCQVMAPAGLSATAPLHEKRAVCRSCRFAAAIARDQAHYDTEQLSSFLTPDDRELVDAQVASTTADNWADIEVDGLPIGRYATYTSMLHHKRSTVSETTEAWAEYLADLRGALLVAYAVPRMIAAADPTHAVVYNALYPANRAFAEGMKRAGAVLMNLSAGPSVPRRYRTLAIYDGIKASQTMTDSASFGLSRTVPASPQEIMHVEEHIAQLMSGSDPWVYSLASTHLPAREVRSAIGTRPDAPVATVIVSSPDETRSSLMVGAEYMRDEASGYSDVAEFLRETINVARSRPHVDFVFRLHPRLAPNKRDRVTSPDLEAIYGLLADLPPNALVNHPSDGLSLYDLVLISSLAINHTSSAGLEFLAFGLPVIQFDPVRAGIYPADFALVVPRGDPASFCDAVDSALRDGFDIAHSTEAFRWYASMQIRSVTHLDGLEDVAPVRTSSPGGSAAPATRHPLGRVLPGRLKEYLAARIQRRQRSQDLASLEPMSEADTRVLLAEIEHVTGAGDVWEPFMVYPEEPDADTEEREVRKALSRLSSRLALTDVDGVGVVAALSVSAP